MESTVSNNNQGAIKYEQIIFIDSTVENYQTLIDNLVQPTEVVILDAQLDGIVQITESLQQYDALNAIHIVSHGDVGELSLGNSKLNQNTLDNYANTLTNWADAIAEHGDILLYGCNVADDLAGAEFVQALSQYTEADILASTDLTGSEALGGDWDLEYTVGNIEAELAFNAEINQEYQSVLNDFFTGDIPIFDNGTFFRDFPTDVTLPGSNLPSAPGRIQLNRVIDAPNIDFTPFDPSIIGNVNFRIDYTPIDLRFVDSEFNPDRTLIDFSQAENQPFTLSFANGNFSWLRNSPNYNYQTPITNSLVFPFDASSLNFNPSNFEFTSIFLNEFDAFDSDDDSITFKFAAGTFDFSSLTSRSSLSFLFKENIADFYDVEYDNIVRLGDNVTFDATGVTFRSDSITFDYQPTTLNFNPGSFAANANLYDYKLSAGDFSAGVSLEQFNASDYRALDYAFAGDELFDSNYYINREGSPSGMNPFSDYIENGYQAGKNPNGLFNVNYYLDNNTDIRLDGGDPLKHYALFGGDEIFDSRDPNILFDSSYYLAKNPDVAKKGMNPLLHYIQFGWQESRINNPGGFNPNRDPSPFFDTSFYFETNTDVQNASFGSSSANALQHYLEFGNNGTVAIENRITHPIFNSENQVAFTVNITSQSEGFTFAQEELAKQNIQLTPQADGKILVASTIGLDPFKPIIDGLKYTIVTGGAYVFGGELVDDTFSILEFVAEQIPYATLSFTVEDLAANPPTFPAQTPTTPQIESFPQGERPENILGTDGKFVTPLEPINEFSNIESFPQRDEILDTLLDEPLIFPGTEEIPAGSYAYPSRVNGTWYQDFLNGENENIVISSPTLSDSVREQNIRDELAVNPALNSRTRGKYKGTRGNIGFADYNIEGKTGTIKAFAGNNDAFVNGIPVMLDGFAPFVPADDRELKTTVVGGFNRAIDSEAKILEEILVNVYEPGDIGTIRLVSTNPICNSCGPVIQNFVESVKETGGEITVEVIQIRLPL